jgi:endonuclease-3
MNTPPNRATLIAKLQKVLKKHYKPVAVPERTLLEHLLYASLLENASFEKADEAFAQLQETYFDWNEVRVTSANELAELFAALPQPIAAAHRVKKLLQGIFDAIFTFDLEPLKKQNLGKSIKDIEKFGANAFAQAYATQNALNGHAIAADEGTFDVLVVLGILSDTEAGKGVLPGLERAVPKNKGTEFFSELHQLAADFYANSNSTKLKALLAEIVPDVKERVAARSVKRKEIQADAAKAAAKERERERQAEAEMMNPQKPAVPKEPPPGKPGKAAPPPAPAAKEPAKDAKESKSKPAKAPEKHVEKPKPVAKKPEPPPAKKKAAEPAKHDAKKKPVESGKKGISKGLTKKKPR